MTGAKDKADVDRRMAKINAREKAELRQEEAERQRKQAQNRSRRDRGIFP